MNLKIQKIIFCSTEDSCYNRLTLSFAVNFKGNKLNFIYRIENVMIMMLIDVPCHLGQVISLDEGVWWSFAQADKIQLP